jgi:hypothetical protein
MECMFGKAVDDGRCARSPATGVVVVALRPPLFRISVQELPELGIRFVEFLLPYFW